MTETNYASKALMLAALYLGGIAISWLFSVNFLAAIGCELVAVICFFVLLHRNARLTSIAAPLFALCEGIAAVELARYSQAVHPWIDANALVLLGLIKIEVLLLFLYYLTDLTVWMRANEAKNSSGLA